MVAQGYKQTEIGMIPENWDVVTIDDVSSVVSGGTPSTTVQAFWNGDINWFTPTEVGLSKYVGSSLRKITQNGLHNSSAKLLPIGTILLTTRAGIGDLAILTQEASTNQGFQSLLVNKKVDNEFFYYLVSTLKKVLLENASGSTFLEISPDKIKKINIPLPPKPEQKAIVTALSDVDELIASLERLIAKKEDIKTATMQQLLTGKKRLDGFSGEWVEKKLGGIGTFSKGSGVRKDEAQSGNIPCVRYGEIYTLHHEYIKNFASYISESVMHTAKKLKQGDLLFAGSGETKEEIGKCVAFLDSFMAFAGGDIVIVSPKNVDSLFMGYLLNMPKVSMQKASKGQGDAVVHISATSLAEIEIEIPIDIKEQKAIATILLDMDKELEALKVRLKKIRAIKIGMMQELLTGKTRLQL